jgi:hypothetical protein
MTAMTWYHLRTPAARQGRRLIAAYTMSMFIVTFSNCLSSVMVLEATVIEAPAGTLEASGELTCRPWGLTNLVVSTLQFLFSDALLVRSLHTRLRISLLTTGHRCTGLISCSQLRKLS